MSELKPCPFCGGEAILESNKLRYGTLYSVYCQKCGAEITRFPEHESVAARNRRTGKDINVATNADRIRGMSDEELARFLSRHVCYSGMVDEVFTLRWIRLPAETEGTE